ncbi:hypothetical protein B0H67DRAFT_551155 [Lasiosphaeris hirsuta]|uniref:Uncharacterized protein n=1 Tax=Lasiosphaeris hirsuta TaxID=260670 RepID=A0AA40B164_9PEZI|nr:hypothetical protein B0H67DRAFT_551155 [Lasiosphaeris hirsuta]
MNSSRQRVSSVLAAMKLSPAEVKTMAPWHVYIETSMATPRQATGNLQRRWRQVACYACEASNNPCYLPTTCRFQQATGNLQASMATSHGQSPSADGDKPQQSPSVDGKDCGRMAQSWASPRCGRLWTEAEPRNCQSVQASLEAVQRPIIADAVSRDGPSKGGSSAPSSSGAETQTRQRSRDTEPKEAKKWKLWRPRNGEAKKWRGQEIAVGRSRAKKCRKLCKPKNGRFGALYSGSGPRSPGPRAQTLGSSGVENGRSQAKKLPSRQEIKKPCRNRIAKAVEAKTSRRPRNCQVGSPRSRAEDQEIAEAVEARIAKSCREIPKMAKSCRLRSVKDKKHAGQEAVQKTEKPSRRPNCQVGSPRSCPEDQIAEAVQAKMWQKSAAKK